MTIFLIVIVSIITAFIVLYNMEAKKRTGENEQIVRDKIREFGQYTSKYVYNENRVILANSDNDIVQIEYTKGKISNIISCSIESYNPEPRTTYTQQVVVKKNTVNTVGRALVGGAIAGGAGAVIGASTSPNEVKTVTKSHTTYSDKSYIVVVKTKDSCQEYRISVKKQSEAEEMKCFIDKLIVTRSPKQKQWIYGENFIKRK